jgi:hypothetical protein
MLRGRAEGRNERKEVGKGEIEEAIRLHIKKKAVITAVAAAVATAA